MKQARLKGVNIHKTSRDINANKNMIVNSSLQYSNEKMMPQMIKKNLPQLKLSKYKTKTIETENANKNQQIEPTKQPPNKKSYSQCINKEIVLPQIKGKKIKRDCKPFQPNNLNSVNLNKLKTTLQAKSRIRQKTQIETLSSICNKEEKDNTTETLDLLSEKVEMINSLFSSLTNIAEGTGPSLPFWNYIKPKVSKIAADILNQSFPHFTPSTISQFNEIRNEDYVQAYAHNTHQGNIRDYNEDTIQATKVNDFYFFGVYDGHGGNGCSIFLRDNLHNNIKEFSIEGIRNAIYETEETFIKTKSLTNDNELADPSGSCGIIVCIKESQCIIANVGDSRCVVFKNNTVDFYTQDHKPGTDIENERITKAGGRIYQTPSFFPLFQNGEEISIPWRVFPGRLSVSRTFGDVEAKEAKFGGMKDVVVALPDLTQITLNSEYNFIILACDGIFDVMSNEELYTCIDIVLKEKDNSNINEICGEAANMIIKSSLAKDSFDNVSCIVIALNMNIK